MAAVHGKKTVFKLDNNSSGAGGTLQDLSAYFDTAGLQRAIDEAEVTGFGGDDKSFIMGLRSATIPVGGPWDPTLDAHMAGIIDGGQTGSFTFEYGPQGSTAGQVRYTGECFVTSYEQNSPVGDKTTWSGTLRVTGTITRNTWP